MRTIVPLLALGLLACATTPPPPPAKLPDYPGALTSPSSHPGSFLRRQKLTAHYGDQTQSFEAVLQKKGDVLTLIGLTPFGTRAFVLEQNGLEVKFTSYIGDIPFPPRYILQDIERVYFDGLTADVATLADGEHVAERDGERIREVWRGGRLQQRDFTRLANDPPGVMSIVYQGGMADGTSPPEIDIDNAWVGYRLSIVTLSEQRL